MMRQLYELIARQEAAVKTAAAEKRGFFTAIARAALRSPLKALSAGLDVANLGVSADKSMSSAGALAGPIVPPTGPTM